MKMQKKEKSDIFSQIKKICILFWYAFLSIFSIKKIFF